MLKSENVKIFAGTSNVELAIITKDVPENSLAVSRSKQIIKNDWRK